MNNTCKFMKFEDFVKGYSVFDGWVIHDYNDESQVYTFLNVLTDHEMLVSAQAYHKLHDRLVEEYREYKESLRPEWVPKTPEELKKIFDNVT